MAGPSGKDGAAGKNGLDGKPGAAGPAGTDGKPGVAGPAGKDGKPGAAGSSGKDGAAGKNGLDGKPGAAGPAGKDGKPGVAGPAGKDGKPGVAGPAGPMGPAGTSGEVRGTGARDVTALLKLPDVAKLDGAVLRRVGNTVELSLSGLRSRQRLHAVLGKVPAGFRPSQHQSFCTSDAEFQHLRVSVDAEGSGEISATQPPAATGLAKVSTSVVWLTDDQWPAKLPGKDWRN